MNGQAPPYIASARMYAVSVAAAEAWRELLAQLARRARVPVQVIEFPAPAPIAELWAHPRKAAVFMCGLPFTRTLPSPYLLAAPVPSPAEFGGQPLYWSEFVVHADSPHRALRDTFGGRIALTSAESQSGFAAPLRYLRTAGGERPLFREVIAPQITPQGALAAVAEGRADVAAIDAYSLTLLRRYAPELVANARVVAKTEPRPIPPLVASEPLESLSRAFVEVREDPALQPVMADLRLSRFARPDPASYRLLASEFEQTLRYWREHDLATVMHPAFAQLTRQPAAE
ncbi:MAG: PhnD/SsuA/transferrin family substrate-binding protein [Steroidobacteraceae bacterium]